jgi:hypothetical protein
MLKLGLEGGGPKYKLLGGIFVSVVVNILPLTFQVPENTNTLVPEFTRHLNVQEPFV